MIVSCGRASDSCVHMGKTSRVLDHKMDETDKIQEKEFGSTKQKWKIRAKSVA